MRVEAVAASDTGRRRKANQDAFCIDRRLGFYVVADGMGGHASGEVASRLCIESIQQELEKNADFLARLSSNGDATERTDVSFLLEHCLQTACSAIYNCARKRTRKEIMGTTCSMLLIAGSRAFMAHVGDSRVYLIRDGASHQLSEDHSLINELKRRGSYQTDDSDPRQQQRIRSAITRAVGVYESVQVDTLDLEVLPGDCFVLCSDGLHQYLGSDGELVELIGRFDNADRASRLVDLANERGGSDNITVISIQIEGPAEHQRTERLRSMSTTLGRMSLFSFLDYKQLVQVMNITSIRSCADQETVIREGDGGDEMFVILQGAVRLFKEQAELALLGPGDHFGELALIDAGPRSATGLAQGDTQLLVIHQSDFYQLVRGEPDIAVKVLWSLLQVLAQRLRTTTGQLSKTKLELLLEVPTQRAVRSS